MVKGLLCNGLSPWDYSSALGEQRGKIDIIAAFRKCCSVNGLNTLFVNLIKRQNHGGCSAARVNNKVGNRIVAKAKAIKIKIKKCIRRKQWCVELNII